MNQDMAWMLLRSLLLMGGGYLVGKGVLADGQVEPLLGACGVLFTLGWQAWVKWDTRSVSGAVVRESQGNPDVPTIPTLSGGTGAVSS